MVELKKRIRIQEDKMENYIQKYNEWLHSDFIDEEDKRELENIKSDTKFLSIAAASILEKNYRDLLMIELHEEFPEYGWNKNMGYATKQHREALKKFGPTKYHRKSFRLEYD